MAEPDDTDHASDVPAPLPGVEGVLGPVDPDPPEEVVERRYPSTIGGAFYILVMVVVTAGLTIAALGSWRFGVQVVAGCLVAMAGVRLVLPQRDAGMLAVRHRAVDAVLLAGSAGVLFFLAATIPNQPG
jgi:hypothetical protein